MAPCPTGCVFLSPIAGRPGGSPFPVGAVPQGQVHGGSCWAEGASSASARSRCPLCNTTGQGGPICYSPCPQTPGPLQSRRLRVHEALRPPSGALASLSLSPRGPQAPAGRWGEGGALQEHRGSSRFRHRPSRLREKLPESLCPPLGVCVGKLLIDFTLVKKC